MKKYIPEITNYVNTNNEYLLLLLNIQKNLNGLSYFINYESLRVSGVDNQGIAIKYECNMNHKSCIYLSPVDVNKIKNMMQICQNTVLKHIQVVE